MGKGVSRRSRFTAVRRRRAGGSGEAATQEAVSGTPIENDVDGVATGEAHDLWPHIWHARKGLQQIAHLLWLGCYDDLFRFEYEHNARECGGGGYQLQPTSWRRRLHGDAAARYDAHRQSQRRDEMAIALHANNMQRWSPSLMARSVCYFNLTTAFLHSTVRDCVPQRCVLLVSPCVVFDALRVC